MNFQYLKLNEKKGSNDRAKVKLNFVPLLRPQTHKHTEIIFRLCVRQYEITSKTFTLSSKGSPNSLKGFTISKLSYNSLTDLL